MMSATRMALSLPRFISKHLTSSVPLIGMRSSVAVRSFTTMKAPILSSVTTNGHVTNNHVRYFATLRSNRELNEFLESEIALEKKAQRKALPTFKEWKVTADGANITLTKTINDEEITVKANVNNAVDTDGQENDEDVKDEKFVGEMICKPEFTVEIKRGNDILGINCSFAYPDDDGEDARDSRDANDENEGIHINEISIYKGEFSDSNYVVSSEVMDGNMYDLLMNMINERGVTDEFINTFTEFCTVYEHGQYVQLLKDLKSFVDK